MSRYSENMFTSEFLDGNFVSVTNHQLYSVDSRNFLVNQWSSPTPDNPLKSYILTPFRESAAIKECVWSGKQFIDNVWYYKFTKESRSLVLEYLMQLITNIRINEYIVNDILDYLLPKSYAPPMFMYFEYDSFLGKLIRNNEVQKNFSKKNLIHDAKTRSGRVIKPPDRFQNREFLKGSGSVGCDHYDREFVGKNHFPNGRGDYGSRLWEKESKTAIYEKNDFVVDDELVDECKEIECDDSDEWSDYSETDEESDLDDWE